MREKVRSEEKKKIIDIYLEYRNQGYSLEQARLLTAKATKRGRTTIYDQTVGVDHAFGKLPPQGDHVETSWPKTYILSSYELRVKPDVKFIECLKQMAEYYDAELLLVPIQRGDVRYLPDVLKDNFKIITDDIQFNSNLQLKYVETTALVQSPLAGYTGAFPGKSTILPGLVKELKSESSQYYIKQLISTGSVGHLELEDFKGFEEDKDFQKKVRTITSRSNSRPTAIAENYIVPSALIVDVLSPKLFLTRFVSSHRSGIVYDLSKKFTPEGYEDSRPEALVVGDTHAYQVDEEAWQATKEMVQFFNPKEVILNDFFDAASVNHHEIGNAVKFGEAPSIREEADITSVLLKEITDISNKVIWLNSNHCNFLNSFLNFGDRTWRLNRNYEVACGLQFFRAQTGLHPIIKLLGLNKIPNLRFVSEKDSHYVAGVLIRHGHEGNSGSRSGFLSLAKIYNRYVQGHSHNMAIYRNAMCVGTTSKLQQDYAIGASAWGHGCGLVQKDGSLQLLGIIEGVWRV